MPQSPAMFALTEQINRQTYGRTRAESWERGVCIRCEREVTPMSFTLPITMVEHGMSALCERCQGGIFGPPAAPRPIDAPQTARVAVDGQTYPLTLRRYPNGRAGLILGDPSAPYTVLSTNMPEVAHPPFAALLDTWNNDRAIIQALLATGAVRLTPFGVTVFDAVSPLVVVVLPLEGVV